MISQVSDVLPQVPDHVIRDDLSNYIYRQVIISGILCSKLIAMA